MAYIKEIRGHTPEIGEGTFVAETAVIVGDVKIGRDCSIWFNAVLRGDVNSSPSATAPTYRTAW